MRWVETILFNKQKIQKKLKYPFSCFLFSDMNKPNHIEMLVKPVLTKSSKGCIYLEEEGDREKKSHQNHNQGNFTD